MGCLQFENQQKIRNVILVSYDAFSEDNWDAAKALPNMAHLIENGTHCTALKSVYPTLTYVVHTTMMTGVYPDRHGIIHNNPLQPFVPEEDQEWYWFRHNIKVPTVYEIIKQKGLTTAGILWPVTGKAKIRYNLPEVKAIGRENQAWKVLKNGSPLFCLDMVRRYGHIRKGIQEPQLDDFSTACAVDTIKRKKPNLLLLHLIDLDEAKHAYGTKAKEVQEAIERMDQRLGQIMQAIADAGMSEQTALIVLGDHGQFDVSKKIRLNNFLQEKGLIDQTKDKSTWKAYFQSTGGAAYLHLKSPNEETQRSVSNLLQEAANDEAYGIEQIFDRKALNGFHVDPTIAYMVEAKKGYSFSDELAYPTVLDLLQSKISYATHGYSPEKEGYHCNFVVSGPGIKRKHRLKNMKMVDIAPTIAALFNMEMIATEGSVLNEIFD
ncbi:MAG: alkaline phosphatase family protein [Clostridia bacterium]|nr:alkaline phosphatase family protein [Clostridia bacterium]